MTIGGPRVICRVNAPRYLVPPSSCASTAQIVEQFGGSLVLRDHGEQAKYLLPEIASGEVKEFLGKFAAEDFPASFVARLPQGRVFGSGNVLSPDGRAIARDVSLDFGKAFHEHWLLAYGKIPPPTPIMGRTAVIATTLGDGYGHWLLEELPRLLSSAEVRSCDAMIAHDAAPCARAAIAHAGLSGRIIPAKRGTHFSCEELIVPSLGRASPSTVQILNDFADTLPPSDVRFGEKLYISRVHARRRKVVNEAALWASLKDEGFEKIDLEALAWAAQIAAFRSAKVIVAPHGAGLANLVFSQRGARVVELFNRTYVNGCYWQIGALKGLDYRPIVSPGDEPLAQQLSANRMDIEVDLVSVMQAIR